MNKLASLIIICVAGYTLSAQEIIRPIVVTAFGRPVVVTGEFVNKSTDYYSQNLIKEPYALKVVTVNGKKLPKPVVIEYKLEVDEKETQTLERKGVVTTFEAYETVYQPPGATPWLKQMEQGTQFYLAHVIHIRPEQKKVNKVTGTNSR